MPIFASFVRDDFPKYFGFRLHKEMCDINTLKKEFKNICTNQIKRNGSIWKEVLIKVAHDCGGIVTLEQVYQNIENKRPTENPFWKEQIRKVIQQEPFQKIGEAKYQLIV